tara:strand:- start:443 stop:658 length:216 start_codon:yes stop_codon:yes gene_type:complete
LALLDREEDAYLADIDEESEDALLAVLDNKNRSITISGYCPGVESQDDEFISSEDESTVTGFSTGQTSPKL